MEQILEVLSRNLKRIREEKNLTQEELSEKCHYDRTYIGKIERGQKYPSLDVISRLSSVLEVPFADLFMGPEDLPQVKYTSARKDKFELDEEAYQRLFSSQYHFLVLFDGEGRVVRVNRDVLELIGKERKEVEGTRFFKWELWNSSDAERLKKDMMKVREGTLIREQVLVSLPDQEGSLARFDLELTPRTESREEIEHHVMEGFVDAPSFVAEDTSPTRPENKE